MDRSFLLAYLAEALVTERFTTWPLHLTVVPWFEAPNVNAVSQALRPILARFQPFKVNSGPMAYFGSKKRTVTLIEPNTNLQRLHNELLSAVLAQGWQLKGRYTGEQFKPHITHKQGRAPASELIIDYLWLVEALPQMYRRRVGQLRLGS